MPADPATVRVMGNPQKRGTQQRVTDAVRENQLDVSLIAELLGCSEAAVRDRIAGRTRWSLEDAASVAELARLSLDELVSWGEDMPTNSVPTVWLAGRPGDRDRVRSRWPELAQLLDRLSRVETGEPE